MDGLRLTIIPALLAMIISLLVSPAVIYIYRYFNWVVDPKRTKHPAHTHKEPVPKGGGVPVFLGTIIPIVLFLPWDAHVRALVMGGLLVVVVGVLDDIFDISPYFRLLTNLIAAAIVIGAGIGINFVTNPFGGGVLQLDQTALSLGLFGVAREIVVWADLFALLWIPFVMNAVNWSSGIDGQIAGVVVIAASTIGVLSFNYHADLTQWPVSVAAFSLAGAFLGYLPYSFYPQKMMPGYGGTSFAGFMLASLAILSTAKVGTALVVLGVPLIDAVYVGIRRLLSGKSPFRGDDTHLHHLLLGLGWGKRRVAIFYWIVTLILGGVALNLNSRQKLYTMVVISLLIGAFILWLSFGRYYERRGRDNG